MKVVLLNSGGLDSALKAKELKLAGHEVHSLFIEVAGQLGLDKIKVASQETANKYCDSHKVIKLDLGYTPNYFEDVSGFLMYDDYLKDESQLWADEDGNLPKLWSGPFYLTGIYIALGTSYAKRIDAEEVFFGPGGNIPPQAAEYYNLAMQANVGLGKFYKIKVNTNERQLFREEETQRLSDYEGEFDYVTKSTPEV